MTKKPQPTPERTVSIVDVAAYAGVSISTVSNVLNGTKSVSDELRARVLQAVDELQYEAITLASGLKSDMTIQPDGAALWHYWSGEMVTGWKHGELRSKHLLNYAGGPAPEDASHGAIDVEFACMAHRDGIVFGKADVDAIAATLTKRMLRPEGKLSRVTDGTGADAPFSSPWLALTHSHPELLGKLGEHVSGTQWLSVFPVRRPGAEDG